VDSSVGPLPMISEEDTQIKWELGTYRHHQSRLLEPLYVRFRHAHDISNFAIAWEIQEKNGSGSASGQLLVSIDAMISIEEVDG
jgi:hypothetical protein